MRGWPLKRIRLTKEFLHPYPALAPLCFFLLGALPAGMWGLDLVRPATCCCVFGLGMIATICAFPGWQRQLALTGLGLALAILHVHAPWRTYRRHLYRNEGYIQLQGVVTDSRLIGLHDLSMLEPKRNIRMRILRSRNNEAEPWQPCRGTVEIANPRKLRLEFGQTLEAEGALRLPFRGTLPHQANICTSLRAKDIEHRFYPQQLRIISRKPRGIYRLWAIPHWCRDIALRALLRNVNGSGNRRVLAAMTLGMQSGITPDDRERFRNSGALHLFAVSGLHVGIAFSILLLVLTLARVPFNKRYFVAPALLFIYVLLTGASPSAVRAWLMLSVWSIGRGKRLPAKPVNTVFVVGLVLLVLNPLNLFQIGFQYSFLLVLAILVGWQQAASILGCIMFMDRLVPFRAQPAKIGDRVKSAVATTLAGMAIFWLGSAGLTLWYNQLIIPFSIIGNALTGVLAWLVLLVSFLKLPLELLELVVPFDVLSQMTATCLGWLVAAVRSLAAVGGDQDLVFFVPKPPLWSLLAYYLSLTLLLLTRNELVRVARRFCLLAACLGLMLLWRKTIDPPPEVCIFKPAAENVPVIVMTNRWRNETVVINTGPKLFSYSISSWLSGEGISRIDHLVLLTPTRDFAAGAADLVKRIPATSITVLNVYKSYLDRTRKKYQGQAARTRVLAHGERFKFGTLTARREGRDHILTVPGQDGRIITLRWTPNRIGPSMLKVQRGNGKTTAIELAHESEDRLITLGSACLWF